MSFKNRLTAVEVSNFIELEIINQHKF
jgi:hypothetical protein